MNQLYSRTNLHRFAEFGERYAQQYQSAEPFPHIVIDQFLPEELLIEGLDAFPRPRELPNREFDDPRQIKLQYSRIEVLPAPLRELLNFLNCPTVLRFLERMTGIKGLIPDPYLNGGGLHQIERGGMLDIHADFNRLEELGLDRRLNLLLYLNQDWKEDYGGHLELWDRSMTRCVHKILPVFNRCVVFSTTDKSYHGHPTPLACPRERNRKSIALYYYTNGRPAEERSEAHSTLFRDRPGTVAAPRRNYRRIARKVIRSLVPPILTDGYWYLRNR
jgi:Rps23 Pro-64 3,4-dihydroxylase Tpa1-like proline 4-hydroxylase